VFKTSISAKKFISLLLLGNTDKGSMKNRFVWAFNKKSTWKLPRCCHCSKPVFLQFSQVTFVRIFGNCFLNCGKDVCAKGLPLFLRYTSFSLSLCLKVSLYLRLFFCHISVSVSKGLSISPFSISLSRQHLFFNS
jgi:hypothetical protein